MRFIALFTLLLITLSSCSFFDNESPEAAYLIIENPSLITTPKEGDPVHQIRDAWVIADGQLVGIFPLPSKVPIIPTGNEMTILISAGIKENADINISAEYPFFVRYEFKETLKPNTEYKINPTYTYDSDTKFDFIENFEGNSQLLNNDLDGDFETQILLSNEDKKSGQKSGLIILNDVHNTVELTTTGYISNDQNARASVYIEFDYKTEEDLYIGYDILSNAGSTKDVKVLLAKTDTWKRAYLNFTPEISTPNTQSYRIFFAAIYSKTNETDSKIFIDNVKLVHF